METAAAWIVALVLAIGGAFAFGVQHGASSVRLEDAKAVAKATAKANAETAKLNDQLQGALNAKAQSDAALAAYNAANPLEPVRLCLAPARALPGAQTAARGANSTAPAAGDVQPLPSGDSGLRTGAGPDVSGLLSVLAGKADALSDQTRALQTAVKGR
jgi:hypothetical protein